MHSAPVRCTGPSRIDQGIGFDARNDFAQRLCRDEAQIQASGRGQAGFRLELASVYVQVDLLPAEAERFTRRWRRAADEGSQPHAEQSRVKIDARRLLSSGQYEVIEMVEHVIRTE